MAIFNINGNRVTIPDGATVSVGRGSVSIGGSFVGGSINTGGDVVATYDETERVRVVIEGNVGALVTRGSAEVHGDAGDVKAGTHAEIGGSCGDVNAGTHVVVAVDAKGDINAGTSVKVGGSVSGDVNAGTSVNCGRCS